LPADRHGLLNGSAGPLDINPTHELTIQVKAGAAETAIGAAAIAGLPIETCSPGNVLHHSVADLIPCPKVEACFGVAASTRAIEARDL
jgi:hypothetical protein